MGLKDSKKWDSMTNKGRGIVMNITTRAAGPISTAGSIRPIESVLKDTRKDSENLHKLLEFCIKKELSQNSKNINAIYENYI